MTYLAAVQPNARRKGEKLQATEASFRTQSALVGLVSVLAVLLVSTPAIAQADPHQRSTPDQMVDALNSVFGQQTSNRAVHAKGVVLTGTFTPSAAAASLTKAPHMQSTPVPVIVRFSDFAGVPTIPDADALASPHGMAIRFKLPDGSDSDLVAHSFSGFPTPTTDDFRELLIALAASGPKAAKPTALDAYLDGHPIAKTFLTTQKGPPVSFATLPYYAVNSFKFTNAAGASKFARYQIISEAGEQLLDKEQLARAGPNYLIEEIDKRVAEAPVKFKLVAQLAEADDKIGDPSIAWPDTRKTVELGEIVIEKPVANNDAAERALLFLPTALPEGIEPADPMLTARSEAYAVSFSRRHGSH
jgi:catalase